MDSTNKFVQADLQLTTEDANSIDEFRRITNKYTDKEISAALGLLAMQTQVRFEELENQKSVKRRQPEFKCMKFMKKRCQKVLGNFDVIY